MNFIFPTFLKSYLYGCRYNVVPSKEAESIHALCIDPKNLKIYYGDKAKKQILSRQIHKDQTVVNNDPETVVSEGVIAQSCVVDYEGSNIFFVEGETRNIQVVSTDERLKEKVTKKLKSEILRPRDFLAN